MPRIPRTSEIMFTRYLPDRRHGRADIPGTIRSLLRGAELSWLVDGTQKPAFWMNAHVNDPEWRAEYLGDLDTPIKPSGVDTGVLLVWMQLVFPKKPSTFWRTRKRNTMAPSNTRWD
jgi:hypothetical protein